MADDTRREWRLHFLYGACQVEAAKTMFVENDITIPVTETKPGDIWLSKEEAGQMMNAMMVARDYLEGESFTKQADHVQVWIELLERKMGAG